MFISAYLVCCQIVFAFKDNMPRHKTVLDEDTGSGDLEAYQRFYNIVDALGKFESYYS